MALKEDLTKVMENKFTGTYVYYTIAKCSLST